MLWHWSAESGVFDAMNWLQGLWASRQAVCFAHSSPFNNSLRCSGRFWGMVVKEGCGKKADDLFAEFSKPQFHRAADGVL